MATGAIRYPIRLRPVTVPLLLPASISFTPLNIKSKTEPNGPTNYHYKPAGLVSQPQNCGEKWRHREKVRRNGVAPCRRTHLMRHWLKPADVGQRRVVGVLDLLAETDKCDVLHAAPLLREAGAHRGGGDGRGQLQGEVIHARGDGGKGHAPAAVLCRQGHAAAVAGGQKSAFPMPSPAPDGAGGMNHIPGVETVAPGDLGPPGLTAVQGAALRQKLGPAAR